VATADNKTKLPRGGRQHWLDSGNSADKGGLLRCRALALTAVAINIDNTDNYYQ
jgi:hypothetical protein